MTWTDPNGRSELRNTLINARILLINCLEFERGPEVRAKIERSLTLIDEVITDHEKYAAVTTDLNEGPERPCVLKLGLTGPYYREGENNNIEWCDNPADAYIFPSSSDAAVQLRTRLNKLRHRVFFQRCDID